MFYASCSRFAFQAADISRHAELQLMKEKFKYFGFFKE